MTLEAYYHPFTHAETLALIGEALLGKADLWEEEATAESFKGAASTSKMNTLRWAADQLRQQVLIILDIPDGEIRERPASTQPLGMDEYPLPPEEPTVEDDDLVLLDDAPPTEPDGEVAKRGPGRPRKE